MKASDEYPQERIDAVMQVVQQAWLKLQTEYERISGGCIAMTIGDKQVLKLVASQDGIILREIREALGMPNSTLTSTIDRLEERGLVRRTISERDRRSYAIELTAGGRAYMALQDQSERDLARRILQALGTEQDQQTFIDILSRVVSQLG
jgi:DNA-binding MarR family transcriptional regulator